MKHIIILVGIGILLSIPSTASSQSLPYTSTFSFSLQTINLNHYPISLFKSNARKSQTILQKIPTAYSYQELGAFCKLEVQLERKTKFPVKIRLGEVTAVELKEGKNVNLMPWQY